MSKTFETSVKSEFRTAYMEQGSMIWLVLQNRYLCQHTMHATLLKQFAKNCLHSMV